MINYHVSIIALRRKAKQILYLSHFIIYEMSLSFLSEKDAYPFRLNMTKLAYKYQYDIKKSYDGSTNVPRMCKYEDNVRIYFDIESLKKIAKEEYEKKELFDYVKTNFIIGDDTDIISQEIYNKNTDVDNTNILTQEFVRWKLETANFYK